MVFPFGYMDNAVSKTFTKNRLSIIISIIIYFDSRLIEYLGLI
jgi:hypothetical protein